MAITEKVWVIMVPRGGIRAKKPYYYEVILAFTAHFYRKACIKRFAVPGDRFTWRQFYQRGYRCVRAEIKTVG